MKVILLPGLDGTGFLFDKLKKEFPSNLDLEVISYESIDAVSYSDQTTEISGRLQDRDVFIVGESYSGRVAYELCQVLGGRVKGVVFIASFISCPSIVSRLATLLPASLLKPYALNKKLLYLFGFSSAGNSQMVASVFGSLQQADKRKLKSRLRNIAYLVKPNAMIDCPVTYIRPSKDRFVSTDAVALLASRCPNFTQVKLKGGHFVAQSSPVECAEVICNAVSLSQQA